MIQEEAFRCKSITEKLLDFTRCGDIQRERTDLAGLIQGVVEMIQHLGKYRGKQIVFQPREAVLAHVDGQEIKQVVLNLVVNALDSMDAGGTLPDRPPPRRGDGRDGLPRRRLRHDRRRSWRTSSSRSSPGGASARGPAWACRSPTGSSASTAARSRPPAPARTRARPSPSACRSARPTTPPPSRGRRPRATAPP